MPNLGIEFCDAGFLTATCDGGEPRLLDIPDENGTAEWPGYAYHDGAKYLFGRAAEDNWFVHPRRVVHNFWGRLAHEPSGLQVGLRAASFSELAFFFLRTFAERLTLSAGGTDQVVFALPGGYLKGAASSEEKIGLLLGMADELKLPLAGMTDMACAALCDPRASGFNPALPVVVLDIHLEGAELTLLTTEGQLERKDFIHLPQSGFAQLLKQLTGTMGNRFLRHTAFDILEDGRIEQTFFRQTKDFLVGEHPEFRFHINTATRGYEMVAKREQLANDAQAFVAGLVQALQSFIRNSPHASEPCTIAVTDRSAHLPGLEARLRGAGYSRLLRLPPGAAASGAACIGSRRLKVPADLADVPVETAVPLSDTRRSTAPKWDARLQKHRESGQRVPPTHAILNGIGHPIGTKPRFTIGQADLGADLALPDLFGSADDCAVPLLHESGRLWFIDAAPGNSFGDGPTPAGRTAIDAGDRLTVRCGNASAEILFAHCPPTNGSAGTS
jgi:hypothetical protein